MLRFRTFLKVFFSSWLTATNELRTNKLRAFLSLLGVTIGIFSIVAVFTVLDSMEQNIRNNMASLGDEVLYVSKWPWGGGNNEEYKWWEYQERPGLTTRELEAVQNKSQATKVATLFYSKGGILASYRGHELDGVSGIVVTNGFEQLQNIDVAKGRYLNEEELNGGQYKAVLGASVYEALFPNNEDANGLHIKLDGRPFTVVGILKASGTNITGFDFDQSVIYPYKAEMLFNQINTAAGGDNTNLMIKGFDGIPIEELIGEVQGILRALHKLRPNDKDDFSINQLSQITEQLNAIFGMINLVGGIIAFFSLLVGGFGIANIMFVTVKERTRMIGLKKALGARSATILTEFLVEAVILCIFGGLIGILMVLILGMIATKALDFPIFLSFKNFLIGIGISTVVGLISGYLPARSAARLNPVVAIRSN